MTCWGVTPCLGVSITRTAVVLGIATLGTPEAVPDWDCAIDATGSIAASKAIMNFIGFSSRIIWYRFIVESTIVLFKKQKNYCSTKLFMKKFLASIKICSRL